MSLYCYNQPQKFGKYDLHLDGKLYVNEVITKSGSIGEYELTAEDVKKVVPIAWNLGSIPDTLPSANFNDNLVIGYNAKTGSRTSTVLGNSAQSTGWNSVAVGGTSVAAINAVAIGDGCTAGGGSVGVGQYHYTGGSYSVGIGSGVRWSGNYSVSIGQSSSATSYSTAIGCAVKSIKPQTVLIGGQFIETVDGTNVTRTCTTEGTGSITIGAGANTLNTTTTNSDGTTTTVESSNSITIGCKANNKAADSIVIGAQASGGSGPVKGGSIAIGAGASSASHGDVSIGTNSKASGQHSLAVGHLASASYHASTALGRCSKTTGQEGVAVGSGCSAATFAVAAGREAKASATLSMALGYHARCADTGVAVIA